MYGKTEGAAKQKMKEEKRRLAQAGDIPTGSPTLEAWLNLWFETVALKNVVPKTAGTWRGIIKNHIIPAIGKVRLDKLSVLHVEHMADAITGKGLSSTTALQAHRILALALKDAERKGRVVKNVAALTDAPRRAVTNLTSLTDTQGIRALTEAARERTDGELADPLGMLWWAVLLTGARQGELLGLQIDRVTDVLEFSWQLQRLSWEHGCDPACGRKRGTDCPQRHLTSPADWEHKHIQGGLWFARPKSQHGWRTIPLVEPLETALRRQIGITSRKPNPHNLVWTMPDGSPVDPRVESEGWDAMLKRAGLPDVRLHDGRHTTVDLLLEAGVSPEVVKDIVGHSVVSTTLAYRTRGDRDGMLVAMNTLSATLALSVGEKL